MRRQDFAASSASLKAKPRKRCAKRRSWSAQCGGAHGLDRAGGAQPELVAVRVGFGDPADVIIPEAKRRHVGQAVLGLRRGVAGAFGSGRGSGQKGGEQDARGDPWPYPCRAGWRSGGGLEGSMFRHRRWCRLPSLAIDRCCAPFDGLGRGLYQITTCFVLVAGLLFRVSFGNWDGASQTCADAGPHSRPSGSDLPTPGGVRMDARSCKQPSRDIKAADTMRVAA